MKSIESTGKTIEEATSAGLQKLGVSISDVTIDVLEEGSKGLFGLFGSRLAKVRLTLTREEDEDLLGSLMNEKKPAPAEKKPAPVKVEAAPAKPAPQVEKPVKPVAPKAPRTESKPAEKPIEPLTKPEITLIPEDQVAEDSAAGRAYAFLKELTHLMGVEVTVSMGTDKEGNVYASMTGDTLGILIGRRGETLDALQYLTSLKVNRGQEGYTRVTLDTENYRAKREEALVRLANRMANRAVKTGRKVSLEPMNPYERRILHSALQGNEQVDTHSEGEEPNRHVVITLKK